MSPRIFITGVSGYIGGHIVGVLSKKHPEYQLVTLVRNEDQAKTINKTWPGVVTVIGDSDDHKLLVREGAQTDVVLRKRSYLCFCAALVQAGSYAQCFRTILILTRARLS